MVDLEFSVEVQASFPQVWKYFSNFQNIPDWDPNTKGCEVIRKNEKEIGSVFNILTVFNQKQSTVSYQTTKFQQTQNKGYICLQGKNDTITARDQISCQRKGSNLTLVSYKADIRLRGILWLFTPFIKSGLSTITEQARAGCVKRSIQKWGKAK